MRTKLLIAAAGLAAALTLGLSVGIADAQAPPDPAYAALEQRVAALEGALGESNLLLLACGYVGDLAEAEGLQVRFCRRQAPEEVNGSRAKATIALGTNAGRFVLEVEFQKSLWWATSIAASG